MGETCFTESLLLDHLEELFVSPPPTIHFCDGVWQDGFQDMKDAGVQFNEGIPETDHLKSWFPKAGLLVLDDLIAGEVKKKNCWIYSPSLLVIKISPCCTCAKTSFHQGNTLRVFPGTPTASWPSQNPRDQLGIRNILLQAFPTCWQNMMDVYQMLTERPFGYMVLDLRPSSDDS